MDYSVLSAEAGVKKLNAVEISAGKLHGVFVGQRIRQSSQ